MKGYDIVQSILTAIVKKPTAGYGETSKLLRGESRVRQQVWNTIYT